MVGEGRQSGIKARALATVQFIGTELVRMLKESALQPDQSQGLDPAEPATRLVQSAT